MNEKSRLFGCGDIYLNVADYSNPDHVKNSYNLYPFIHNIRATGNTGTVFLTYGDIDVNSNGSPDGPERFVRTFFAWFNALPQERLAEIFPIGISFDCEHLSVSTIERALSLAQSMKSNILESKLGNKSTNLIIQWAVEGHRNPESTDTIMRLADSALMMGYRNHSGPSPIDPSGSDTITTRFLNHMLRTQCPHCLDESYSVANYGAKLKLMVESACDCKDHCRKVSFCANDTSKDGWGHNHASGSEYLVATLQETLQQIKEALTAAQFERLFGTAPNKVNDLSIFVIHSWEWFTCSFETTEMSAADIFGNTNLEICSKYRELANTCRSNSPRNHATL